MIDAAAIRRLQGPEEEARRVFDENAAQIAAFARRFLRKEREAADLVEDAVARTLERLWSIRKSIQTEDSLGFWSLTGRAASYGLADARREAYGRQAVPIADVAEEILEEIPEADRPYLDALAIAAEERHRLGQAADELWLQISGQRPDFDRWVLAAQLFYLHDLPWEEVAKIVGPVTREALDEWLADLGTINALAFCEIYQDSDTLCAHLLGCRTGELDRIFSQVRNGGAGAATGGWSPEETFAIVLRYRNGLNTDQILRFEACRFDRAGLEALFERCRTRLPFENAACRLLDRLGSAALEVAQSGVWRRLAFQYSCVDDLPLKQVAERTEPATHVFGVGVAQSTLNVWLSGGRLITQLARYIREGQ